MRHSGGYSLVELMIAITLATVMSLGVLGIFVNQTGNIRTETQRDTAAQEANRTFELLSRLLRQADRANMQISYPTDTGLNANDKHEISNDAITVDFILPEGFRVWPNDIPPYNNNAIRLAWNNNSSSDSAHIIQLTKANSIAELDDKNLQDIAGANSSNSTLARIINLDVWPMLNARTPQAAPNATGVTGYLLRVTSRAAQPDLTYVNPNDPEGPLKHYRTHTVSGIIFPRN